MSTQPSLGRVDSMDQFRGFTVISMFLVNFVHHMDNMHPVWMHNKNYFSFADWIMPGFIFAVGFSYRLTVLKRLQQYGPWKTYWTYFRRSLALILLSLMLAGWGDGFRHWKDFSEGAPGKGGTFTNEIEITTDSEEVVKEQVNPTLQFVMRLLKSNLWEVLAIIGVAQIFIMPVIACGSLVRFLAMIGCLVGHVFISWWFNWGFVHGDQSNWMVQLWKTGGNGSWDGGFFGIMSWSVSMLAGSLVYDILVSNSRGKAGGKVFFFGAVFMIIGYALSCGTRLYDVPLGEKSPEKFAANPMVPDFSKAQGRSLRDLLAEPPFVMPPHHDPAEQTRTNEALKRQAELAEKPELTAEELEEFQKLNTALQGRLPFDHARQWNYWMMYKQIVSAPFILFTTGFAIALYALFILLTDLGGLHVGVFRTFGMNPLAAYVFHHLIAHSLEAFTPNDAPQWYCWVITGVFIGITYLFVRHLEKHNIYIRL